MQRVALCALLSLFFSGCVTVDPKSCEEGLQEGTPCDDGNLCTIADTCSSGACIGIFQDCAEFNDECQFGQCDTTTGTCIKQSVTDNSNCEDGDGCTVGETCQGGLCQGGTLKVCPSANACVDGICDVETGECLEKPRDDGSFCGNGGDGNACTGANDTDFCLFDANLGNSDCTGDPVSCTLPANFNAQCATIVCVPSDNDGDPCQISFVNENQTCNDGNANTVGEKCNQGLCADGAPACTDTDPEPNNTANEAAINALLPSGGVADDLDPTTVSNPNLCPSDVDLYAIDLPIAGDGLAIEVHDNIGACSFDSVSELRRNDGTSLGSFVSSDDNSGEGNCPRIDPAQDVNASNLAAGTFFALVKGKTANDIGAYQVEVDTTVDADGAINSLETEPNNTTATADRPDLLNGSFRGRLSNSSDIDLARFEISTKSRLFAVVSNGAGGCAFDSKLEVLNSAGALIASASNGASGVCPQIDLTFAPPGGFIDLDPGSFFFKISSENGAAGFYQLDSLIEALEHGSNDNSTLAEGPFITAAVEGAFADANDVDFFKLTLTAPASIFALTRGPQGAACGTTIDTIVELRDISNVVLARSDDINVNNNRCSQISSQIAPNATTPTSGGGKDLPPGTYFISVRKFANSATTTVYRLDIVTNRVSESEPNATLTTADPIPLIPAQKRGALEARLTPFSVDLFSVDVPQGSTLQAETSDGATGCAVDTLLQIRGLDGRSTSSLATDDDSGNGVCSIATAANLPAGKYFIAVSPFVSPTGVSDEGPYVISVTITP
jgi:hypothetical protein